jgi:glucose-1-phosphate cytidylyltransferase
MVRDYLQDEDFLLTYGDGVSDVDISALVEFHRGHGKIATVTAIQPAGRFGALKIDGVLVSDCVEKPDGDGNWINGGFFMLKPSVFDYLTDDPGPEMWEGTPMKDLAASGELVAFRHFGFWHAMDTLRDKAYLEKLYAKGNAPWVTWE